MNILLTNDDSLSTPGLELLRKELCRLGKVTTVIPSNQRSASSHAITIFQPLFINKILCGARQEYIYTLDGTPTDCVKIALSKMMKKLPDIVVSGINAGANVGVDVFYSGTVAAALEASLWGLTSFAVSVEKSSKRNPDFKKAARKSVSLIKSLLAMKPARGSVFNINLPNQFHRSRIKGTKFTHQDLAMTRDEFIQGTDPRGRHYYWMKSGPAAQWQKKRKTEHLLPILAPSDLKTLRAGYISITPLKANFTDYQFLANPPKI